jgi:capsular polysaccharide biosynthesis protein
MSFADAVASPAILDKTEQEEEQEEEEDEENNLRQECRTSVQDDTEAPGLSEQTQEPNDAEHRGIKNLLYKCCVVCYVCKTVEVQDVTALLYKFMKSIKEENKLKLTV